MKTSFSVVNQRRAADCGGNGTPDRAGAAPCAAGAADVADPAAVACAEPEPVGAAAAPAALRTGRSLARAAMRSFSTISPASASSPPAAIFQRFTMACDGFEFIQTFTVRSSRKILE